MGRGLRFSALFFVLVSLWLSSMLYGAKARPLNGLGLLPGNAGETDRGFEESLINGVTAESLGLSAGGKGDAHKYSTARTAEEVVKYTSGPSPGQGHKNVPSNNQ
jgi:hypothetical protein